MCTVITKVRYYLANQVPVASSGRAFLKRRPSIPFDCQRNTQCNRNLTPATSTLQCIADDNNNKYNQPCLCRLTCESLVKFRNNKSLMSSDNMA